MGKFKPCPFCGNREIEVLPQDNGIKMIRCWICTANITVFTESKRSLYAAWNNRLEPKDNERD